MLAGIFLRVVDDSIVFASTDSYRLSEFRIPKEKREEKNISFIIPKQTATEIVRLINDENI